MELIFALQGCECFQGMSLGNVSTITTEKYESIWKHARICNLAAGMTMLLFGIPGAVLSTVVSYKNSSKKSSVKSLFIANSLTNVVVLVVAVPNIIMRCYSQIVLPWRLCATMTWLVATMNCISVYSLIMLLTTRYLAMAFPHTLFIKLLSKTGVKSTFGLTVVCGLYCIRFFFAHFHDNCIIKVENMWTTWIYIMVEFILPVVLTLLLSVFMMLLIKNDKQRVTSRAQFQQSALFKHLTLLSSAWILMSSLPSIVHFNIPKKDTYGETIIEGPWPVLREHVAAMVILNGFFIRHAFDVFVYLAFSRRFREGLVQVMRLNKVCGQTIGSSINLEAITTAEDSSRSLRFMPMASRSLIIAQLQRESSQSEE